MKAWMFPLSSRLLIVHRLIHGVCHKALYHAHYAAWVQSGVHTAVDFQQSGSKVPALQHSSALAVPC